MYLTPWNGTGASVSYVSVTPDQVSESHLIASYVGDSLMTEQLMFHKGWVAARCGVTACPAHKGCVREAETERLETEVVKEKLYVDLMRPAGQMGRRGEEVGKRGRNGVSHAMWHGTRNIYMFDDVMYFACLPVFVVPSLRGLGRVARAAGGF